MQGLRTLSVAGCFALSAVAAVGQSRDDGSLYSQYGLGELRSFPSSRAQAMGGGGLALWSFDYANYANPAALSRQLMVRASVGMRFDNISTVDSRNRDKRLLAGSFSAIQFGLPLKAGRIGLGFAFEPYSRMNYKVTTTGTLAFNPMWSDTPYTVVTQGAGGLQRLRLGMGVRPLSVVSLGISMDYLFGITEESRRTMFDSVSLIPTNVATSTRMRGLAMTGGTILAIPVGEDRELSVAGTMTLPAALEADRTRTVGESLDLDTLGATISGDVTLPVSAAAGVAFAAKSRWTFAADIRHEPWTRFESGLALTGYRPAAMRDRTRLSAGAEWLPAGSSRIESYLQRTAYRLGFYMDQAYISPMEGQNVTTQAITAGISLPTRLGGTRLDLNVQVGRRGSTTGILVQDRFVTVSATLNAGERWFLKRRLG